MESINDSEKVRLERARRRVAEVKGFYIHVVVYLTINTTLLVVKIIGTSHYGDYFMGPIWHFSTFATWLFWGIGLAFHGVKTFSNKPFFGKRWEERQIQKFMEEEKRDAKKFTDY